MFQPERRGKYLDKWDFAKKQNLFFIATHRPCYAWVLSKGYRLQQRIEEKL